MAAIVVAEGPLHAAAVRAFPGAEGAGAYSTGGRGGDVYHVTNLLDEDGSGNAIPGSLRYGIKNASGPRTIVFDVSGTIELTGKLKTDRTNITIAGQTAPGDGICVKNYHMTLEANNLIARFIRARVGHGSYNTNNVDDSISIGSGTNIIADHISASYGGDENFSCTRQCWNVTVQWCVISDSLNFASHGYGSLISPELNNTRISWHHNLYANNLGRTPRAGSRLFATNFVFDYVNNVNYNWGTAGDWGCWGVVGGTPNEETLDINFINNYSIAGANTTTTTTRKTVLSSNFDTTRIYQSGNLIDSDRNGVRNGTNAVWDNFRGTYLQMGAPFAIDPANAITTTDVNTAYVNVLHKAGASLSRDAADTRAVNYVRYQTGSIITDPSQVGNWPTLVSSKAPKDPDGDGMATYWEIAVALNPSVADGNLDRNGDGYTELEDYLTWLAGPHGVATVNFATNLDLRALNGKSGTNLSFSVADGTNGTVSLLGDGYTARFAPATNLTGLASFSVTATDVLYGVTLDSVTVRMVITPSNTPPVVSVLPDRTITAGSTLNATFSATDADDPSQTILFSLPGGPSGASLNATNGVLTWRPAIAQSGTNLLPIVATDNGWPSLSSTQFYTVIVNPPRAPGFQSAGITNSRISMVVTGVFNPDYSIQATTNLASPSNWVTLLTTNSPLLPLRWTDTNLVNTFRQRFYRVRLGP